MIYTPITYGGFNINDGETYTTVNLVKELGAIDVDLITIPGRDGAIAGATALQPIKITCDIVIEAPSLTGGDRHSGNRAALARLTAALAKSAQLLMPGEIVTALPARNITYDAIASGGSLKTYPQAFVFEGVTFTVPAGYGYWDDFVTTSGTPSSVGYFQTPGAYTFELDIIRTLSSTITLTGDEVVVELKKYSEEDEFYYSTGIQLQLDLDLPSGTEITRLSADFASRTVSFRNETEGRWVTTFASLESSWEPSERLDPTAKYMVFDRSNNPYPYFIIDARMLDVI